MKPPRTKLCKSCDTPKLLEQMCSFKSRGKTYFRHLCKSCRNAVDRERSASNPERRRVNNARRCRDDFELRRDIARQHLVIWRDSRANDKKKGRENNVTREFIAALIENGCSYCGEAEIRMSLDRIDNSVGHLQGNVVAACIRCNLVRRDMPYAAWLVVAKGMRAAREEGLFLSWKGGGLRK